MNRFRSYVLFSMLPLVSVAFFSACASPSRYGGMSELERREFKESLSGMSKAERWEAMEKMKRGEYQPERTEQAPEQAPQPSQESPGMQKALEQLQKELESLE